MYEGPVQNLIDEFGKLPGIGPKSAQRLAFHLLQAEPESVERLRTALQAVVEGVTYCEICGTVAAAERCRICSDPRRDPSLVCVVEEPKDIEAIERTREFNGLYHVLGGALDPINGVGPNELRIAGLMRRVGQEFEGAEIAEIIIATDPNTTGEATSTYLARLLRPFPDLVVSRLASGLPMGADLEFADELTLGSALSGRRILSGERAQGQVQSQGHPQPQPQPQPHPPRSGHVLQPEQYDTPPPPPEPASGDVPPPPPEPADPDLTWPTPQQSSDRDRSDRSEAEQSGGVSMPDRP
ncbi:recombination protein RecR [Dietzia aerolata]|nr:recombination protein RecR [Dietzia aerolata]